MTNNLECTFFSYKLHPSNSCFFLITIHIDSIARETKNKINLRKLMTAVPSFWRHSIHRADMILLITEEKWFSRQSAYSLLQPIRRT